LGYGLTIADKGIELAIDEDEALKKGINTLDGKITYKAVAEAFDMEWCEI
jgi:alanine dehydrogenase